MDTPDTMFELIKHLMDRRPEVGSGFQVKIVKMAGAIDYSKYPVFEELYARNEMVKEAAEKSHGDSFGNRSMRLREKTRKIPMDSFAAYKLNFVNGDTITSADYGFRDMANTFVPTGAVHSIIGILPNGVEKIIYHQSEDKILDQ
jgi:hypothetical protein